MKQTGSDQRSMVERSALVRRPGRDGFLRGLQKSSRSGVRAPATRPGVPSPGDWRPRALAGDSPLHSRKAATWPGASCLSCRLSELEDVHGKSTTARWTEGQRKWGRDDPAATAPLQEAGILQRTNVLEV